MPIADRKTYLAGLVELLNAQWPGNRAVNIVCHGHSVPAGYFATPMVDTFNAYPHLLHAGLKARFPFAVVNVIVTAIGGENAEQGAARFDRDVLDHHPDVLTIDYGLNDRRLGLTKAEAAWRSMIERALGGGSKVLLLTPTWDVTQAAGYAGDDAQLLIHHADLLRRLAGEYEVGLADSFAAFADYAAAGGQLADLLSWPNHPNRAGHDLVARELLRWFAMGGA